MKTRKMSNKQAVLHAALLKKFHTLLCNTGDSVSVKALILTSYNVCSSKDLSIDELKTVCDKLVSGSLVVSTLEIDKWRKRLLAAIGGWLKSLNKQSDISIIKSIACRASGKQSFNAIPKERLISLYNAFVNKAHDMKRVEDLNTEELDLLINMN